MNFEDTRFRVKNGFIHRKVSNEDILISVGDGVANFNGYILLNPTASFLWDILKEPHNIQELTNAIAEEFEISSSQATDDVIEFMQMLINKGMVEEVEI